MLHHTQAAGCDSARLNDGDQAGTSGQGENDMRKSNVPKLRRQIRQLELQRILRNIATEKESQ